MSYAVIDATVQQLDRLTAAVEQAASRLRVSQAVLSRKQAEIAGTPLRPRRADMAHPVYRRASPTTAQEIREWLHRPTSN